MLGVPEVRSLNRKDLAEEVVAHWAPSLNPRVVYDIGAGDGSTREHVEALGLQWCGFDLHPEKAEISRWDLDDPCPVGSSDCGLVLLLEVIEHLRNPGRALRHVAQVLPAGGLLLISTPNPRWSRSRLDALRTGFLTCFTQQDLDTNSHVFPVWPHVLERLLQESGFSVVKYLCLDGATRWPRRPLTLRYPIRFAYAAASKWLESRDPSACGMAYAILARRGRVSE